MSRFLRLFLVDEQSPMYESGFSQPLRTKTRVGNLTDEI